MLLTNLGYESEYAKLDNRKSFSGGSTSIATHSRKNIVATKKKGFLDDSSFTEIRNFDKTQKRKWGKNVPEVKLAGRLERDFIETVKLQTKLALLK